MDKGGSAAKIAIEGEFVGEGAVQGITELRKKYKEGEPLEFVSDLAASAGINKVLLEELHIEGLSGLQSHFRYHLLLRQYTPPPQEEEAAPSQDQNAEEEVEKESDLHSIKGKVLDVGGKPKKDVKVNVKSDSGEWQLTTDENGIYNMKDPAEGEYTVTIDDPGYKGKKRVVKIKKGEEK
jgi:hypothetical protein